MVGGKALLVFGDAHLSEHFLWLVVKPPALEAISVVGGKAMLFIPLCGEAHL